MVLLRSPCGCCRRPRLTPAADCTDELLALVGIEVMLDGLVAAGAGERRSILVPNARFLPWLWHAARRPGPGTWDLLVAIGTTAGYGMSPTWAEARRTRHGAPHFEGSAVVITLVLLGNGLKPRAKRQHHDAIRAQRPRPMWRGLTAAGNRRPGRRGGGGDTVIVRPRRAPAGGRVVSREGHSHVDKRC